MFRYKYLYQVLESYRLFNNHIILNYVVINYIFSNYYDLKINLDLFIYLFIYFKFNLLPYVIQDMVYIIPQAPLLIPYLLILNLVQ